MQRSKVKSMILIALFVSLITIGAYIKIPNPFFPVFFTLQGAFCAFAGLLLGSKRGACAVALYVAMGLLGLPVFSMPSGPQYVFQPTFGFLAGLIAAAYIIGKISESAVNFSMVNSFIASFSGLMIFYVIGILHMYLILNFYNKTPVGVWAVVSGMSLYFLKDLILFTLVAFSSVPIRKRIMGFCI